MTRYLLLVLIGSAALACGEGDASPTPPLEGRTWRLLSFQRGTEVETVATPDRYTARFEGGRVSVQSDCNVCSGGYTLDGSEIRIGALACTRAFCGPESFDPEFAGAVSAATTALGSTDTLVLYGRDVTLHFGT